jgi:excisionase family DNA binding protein
MMTRNDDLLTVDQFAQRLQVSRTTVFSWLKKGELQEGVHYFHLGRTLRFCWPFFPTARPLPEAAGDFERKPLPASPPSREKRLRSNKPAINLDY